MIGFFEALQFPFMYRALIVGVLVSLCAALLGVVLVLKHYSLIGHGLGEVGFAALALAVALDLPPMTSWEQVYQQEFPEVAPAQPKKTLEVVKSEAPARPSPKKAPEKPSGKHRKEQKGEAVPQPAKSSKAGQELMEKTVITGKTAAFIPVPQEAGTEEAGPTEVQPISLKESYIREVDRISERYDACRKARSWDMCIRHLRRLEEVIMQIRNYCEPDSAQMSIEDLPGVMPKGGADE